MFRFQCLLIAFCLGNASAAEPPQADAKLVARVTELIREFGGDDFDRRQAAQKELAALGRAAIPVLDASEPFVDAEVAFRIQEVRRQIGGFSAELRRALEAHAPSLSEPESRLELGPRTLKLISDHQPEAGDFLLTQIADPKRTLHRPAVNAFVQTWGLMTPDQIRTYLERSLLISVARRAAYPRGVDAMIGVSYQFRQGWGSLPHSSEPLKMVTETVHTLDGKPDGFLAVGRHSLSVETKFEVVHAGKPVAGSVRSAAYAFEVSPADAPDDLAGPKHAALEKRVRAALWMAETDEPGAPGARLPNLIPRGGPR